MRQWTRAELLLPQKTRDKILLEIKRLNNPRLGDKIAAIATPIARALRLPCIDKKTGQLKNDSGCAKRRKKLNQLL